METCGCGKPATGIAAEYYHGDSNGYPAYTWPVCDECGERANGSYGAFDGERYRQVRSGNRAQLEALVAEYERLGWDERDPWRDFPDTLGREVELPSGRKIHQVIESGYVKWKAARPDEYELYEMYEAANDFLKYAFARHEENARRRAARSMAARKYDGD